MEIPPRANNPRMISEIAILRLKKRGSIMAENNPEVDKQVSAIEILEYLILP